MDRRNRGREQARAYREQYGPRYRRVSRGGPPFLFGLFGLVVILGIIASIVLAVLAQTHHESFGPCTVVDKSATSDSKGTTHYRIYTSDCGTFSVADAPFQGKFNSADTYGRIEVKHTYTFQTVGFRNGFLSWFPNILSVSSS